MMRIVVNGRTFECEPGTSMLAALARAGAQVPALCHDDRLEPTAACRSCLVSVNHAPHLVPACATPLAPGMIIATDTAELQAHRRQVLTLLARTYPREAVAQNPTLPFHRLIVEWGLEGELGGTFDDAKVDASHPYLAVDMSRCIDCDRCVRICDDLQGQNVWHVRDRGVATRIVPDGPSLAESSCVSCGACADTCPTGALSDARVIALGDAATWTRTTCPYCGVGCEMSVGARAGTVVAVRPVLDAPVSRGHLCVKGRYAFEFAAAADRITEPMLREGDGWRPVSWEEAYAFVASRLEAILAAHGPRSVGVLGSARATNEDNYVAQKFARVVLGTNNVDCCARVCHAPSAAGLKAMLGAGLSTNSFADIEVARAILVVGANTTEDHPVVGARIRQAARRGATLIVVDPRQIELTWEADCHLAIRPGTNIPLLHAMAHTIISEGWLDHAFLEDRVDNLDAFARAVAEWPAERAAEVCGVRADEIRRAARLYATARPAMTVHGLGLTEHTQGTDSVKALINLALLTGNIGKPGAGVNPLRGQNNVQGSAHMGCEPVTLPGATPMADRARVEEVWGAAIPADHGLTLLQMLDQAVAGRFKALWTIGYDVLLSNPNMHETRRAFAALDLVIIQDLFLTETAREFGTVFLPACSSFEKDGTFMNGERRIQRVRAAVRPMGASKPDWQIVADVAHQMNRAGFAFGSAEEVWDEVRAVAPGARGMTYARLDAGGLQWPCPDAEHPGTAVLHAGAFTHGRKASLAPIAYRPTSEQVSDRYPFVLVTGRSLYHFNAGTMTNRTPNRDLRPSDTLDVSSADAAASDIRDGDQVRVISAYGETVLPVRVTDVVPPGQLFATFQTPEFAVNAVTSPLRDEKTGTPEYKVTAVRLEKTV